MCDFNKIEMQAVIKFLFLQGKAPKEIHTILTKTLTCFHPSRAKNLSAPQYINPLMPNDHYSGHTTPLTSKCCILYICSTNTGTEYFKHGIHSLFFSLQNAVSFMILTYLVPVLFTFYIQCVLKFKKIILVPKG